MLRKGLLVTDASFLQKQVISLLSDIVPIGPHKRGRIIPNFWVNAVASQKGSSSLALVDASVGDG